MNRSDRSPLLLAGDALTLALLLAGGLFAYLSAYLSPYGLPDLIFGSLATLIAGLLTARCRNKWLAPLPPVLCNGLIVGALLTWAETGFTAAFPATFAFNAVSVGGAELLVCYVLGLPLLALLDKTQVMPRRLA